MIAWTFVGPGSCALLLAAAASAHAESLRCNGATASEGDSRIAVYYKCGPPLLQEVRCATVVYPFTLYAVPEPFASTYVPCQAEEEWLYERGPGNLVATVRFRGGIVQSIRYGRPPGS